MTLWQSDRNDCDNSHVRNEQKKKCLQINNVQKLSQNKENIYKNQPLSPGVFKTKTQNGIRGKKQRGS